MVVKPRRTPGVADVSDLSVNEVVKWQHRWYVYLIVGMGFVFPTLVAGLGWGDYRGGFFFAGAARLLFVHHVRPSPSLFACARSHVLNPLLLARSRPSASTRSPTGSVRRRSTTSTRRATTGSRRSSPSARATTTSTTSSLRTSATPSRPSSVRPCSLLVVHVVPHGPRR